MHQCLIVKLLLPALPLCSPKGKAYAPCAWDILSLSPVPIITSGRVREVHESNEFIL